jgi:hypothetical protein
MTKSGEHDDGDSNSTERALSRLLDLLAREIAKILHARSIETQSPSVQRSNSESNRRVK